jgi:uncharacterized coiled-coil DUF342 family protein
MGHMPDWCTDARLWRETHEELVAEVLDTRADLKHAHAEIDAMREDLRDVDRGIRTFAEVLEQR